ncbi:unnamed protein product [Arabidopsis halleri]
MEIPPSLVERFNKGLDAYDAIFYISYKDFCKARVDSAVVLRAHKPSNHQIPWKLAPPRRWI